MDQSFFKAEQAFFDKTFDAQSFFDDHCQFTDQETDFVLLKDLYALVKDKPTWRVFKRKMSLAQNFYPVKYLEGKRRYNLYWKVVKIDRCDICQGRDEIYLYGNTFTKCGCMG